MTEAEDDPTRAAVARALESNNYFVETVPAEREDRVAQLRRVGREAARQLGWRTRTGAIDLGDGRLKVWIVAMEAPDDRRQIDERASMIIEWLLEAE